MSSLRAVLGAVLGLASVANAGITVSMTPTNAGPYNINNPASLGPFNVDIFLSQDPAGSREGLRLVRFDLAETDPAITLPTQITFRYTGVTTVPSNAGYASFRNLPLPNTVYQPSNYPNQNANDPDFSDPDNELFPWNLNMLVLLASGNYRVASLVGVTLPAVPGVYLLDVMNSDSYSVGDGAQVTYGFGIDPNDPRLDLRANEGNLSGGQLWFTVVGVTGPDCNDNRVPDSEEDCNSNGIPDECEVHCAGSFCGCQGAFDGDFFGASNGLVEASVNCGGEVTLKFVSAGGHVLFQSSAAIGTDGTILGDGQKIVVNGLFNFETCSAVGTWHIAGGTEGEWNIQLVRECLPDCNDNLVPDDCDIRDSVSFDCNNNDVPDECDLASGLSFDCNGNNIPDECEDPPVFRIVSSQPPHGIIDARQDRSITGLTPQGFDRLRLAFSCQPFDAETSESASADSFDVTSTAGSPPLVLAVQSVDGAPYTFDVILSDPIPPGAWTTITAHVVSPDGIPIDPASNRVTLGLLPGDVNSNGTAAPSDILDLIDDLNQVRVPALHEWQCDIDRSALCAPADILREIDLLNGARTSRPWNGATLPPRP